MKSAPNIDPYLRGRLARVSMFRVYSQTNSSFDPRRDELLLLIVGI
jgi:hypothetical protein